LLLPLHFDLNNIIHVVDFNHLRRQADILIITLAPEIFAPVHFPQEVRPIDIGDLNLISTASHVFKKWLPMFKIPVNDWWWMCSISLLWAGISTMLPPQSQWFLLSTPKAQPWYLLPQVSHLPKGAVIIPPFYPVRAGRYFRLSVIF